MKRLKLASTGHIAVSTILYIVGSIYIALPHEEPAADSAGRCCLGAEQADHTAAAAGVFGMLLIARPVQSRFAAHIIAGGVIAGGMKHQCVVTFTVKAAKSQQPERMGD